MTRAIPFPVSPPSEPEPGSTVRVASRLFGPLDLPVDECFRMPTGMLGFAGDRRFALLPAATEGVFWYQSVEDGALTFLAVDPFQFFPGYEVDLPDVPAERRDATMVLAIVTLPRRPNDSCTANLVAPLVLDIGSRTAHQAVLSNTRYTTQHPLEFRARPAAG